MTDSPELDDDPTDALDAAVNAPDPVPPRLTSFSHGGGCGCKIAPGVLQEILGRTAPGLLPKALLVGVETSDDAAVYQLNDHQAIVATTDFFMPIVDDPFDFGAIAATNALSDVYAMGATPLFALALVGMPVDKLPIDTIRRILAGGESVCARAGIPVAGGHTIDSVEPIYGLVAVGVVDPKNVKRNAGARPGDALILGKPLGVGIYSAALKKGLLSPDGYAAMLASTTQLNTPGIALGAMPDVHALTDVTGFGLLGHLMEICRGSEVAATIDFSRLPLHPGVRQLARDGIATGASERNWAGVVGDVELASAIGAPERALLTDPQTSGGLLVACAPGRVPEILSLFHADGFTHASVIGTVAAGAPRIAVR
jgi:selenide,water dikinase